MMQDLAPELSSPQSRARGAVSYSPISYPRGQLTLEHGFSSLTLRVSLIVLHFLF
jgi:hypothetical protein